MALFVVVAVPNAVAVILTHKRSRWAVRSNLISATILLLWIGLEFYVWGTEPLSCAYLAFGAVQVSIALFAQLKME